MAPLIIRSRLLTCLITVAALSSTNCSARTAPNSREVAINASAATPQRRTNRQPAPLLQLSGLVVNVKDGDTIAVMDGSNVTYDVRLQGIDAPEKSQDFSNVARRHLADLIGGKQVSVEYKKLDLRKRIVGKVTLSGLDVCLEQIKAGLAWHYKEFESEQTASDRMSYSEAEQEARAAKRGLWQYPSPTPPWVFRHAKETQTEPQPNKPRPTSASVTRPSGAIIGNKNSMIYHWPGCPNYNDVAPWNRVYFKSREDAERAGYRAARNCN